MTSRKSLAVVLAAALTLTAIRTAHAACVSCVVFGGPGPWPLGGPGFVVDGVTFAPRGFHLAPGLPPLPGGVVSIALAPGLGAGQAIRLTNVCIAPDIAPLFPAGATTVTFDYRPLGGLVNLRVNGALAVAPNFAAIPAGIFPGVVVAVIPPIPPGVAGTVTITAAGSSIANLQIGGANQIIDNICMW